MEIINYNSQKTDDDTYVSLPIAKKDFVNFVTDLLGQPQSIEQYIASKFDINHDWLTNLHLLIHQRITQQTSANLINFSSVIYFDDKTKRTLNDLSSFMAYNETLNKIQVGIKITWEYLVQFPNKQHPEKQQINFRAFIHKASTLNLRYEPSNIIGFSSAFSDEERSDLHIQINHTERTWGDDILSLLENQITDITRNNIVKDSFFNACRKFLCFGSGFVTTLYALYKLLYSSQLEFEVYYNKLQKLGDKNISLSLINEKINISGQMMNVMGHVASGVGPFLLYCF